jgi:hypothetical protein
MSQPYPPPYPQSSSQTPSSYSPYPQNAYQQPLAAPQYPQNAYQQPSAAPQYAQNAYQQPPASPAMDPAVIPSDVLQQAAAYQLGTHTQTYKRRFSPIVAVGIAVIVSILDIIVLVAILVASGYFLGILIVIPIAMIVFAGYSLALGNTQIYVFTNGLIQAKGQQRDVIRWDQIEATWQRVIRTRYSYFYSSTSYKYTVRRSDGATFKFGSPLKDVANLGKTLQQEVSRLHTPRAIAAYDSGVPVTFGMFTLGTLGISNGRETLPWNMVKGIDVNGGMIFVKKEGQLLRWASADVSSIPNYPVFVNVANHALKSMGKAVQLTKIKERFGKVPGKIIG